MTTSASAHHSARRRLKSIFGGSVGNLVEWYDWYTYSAFAIYFAHSFFPEGNQTAKLLNVAAVFAVGFLVRPIGGWIMGRYADRHGRKAALAALYLRRNLAETEAFANSRAKTPDAGAMQLLLRHPREALTVIGLTMGGTLFFYVFTNYMQKFLVNTVGLTKGESTLISAGSLFAFMLLQPLMGALSDRVGRRPMLIVFGVLALFTTIPLLSALERTHDVWVAFALVMTALLISSLYSSISAVVKAELFPVEIRALGVGLPYAIAVSLFGGTAEYIALWFKSIGHESLFYWYVTGCVFISLLVYAFMQDTQKTSRI